MSAGKFRRRLRDKLGIVRHPDADFIVAKLLVPQLHNKKAKILPIGFIFKKELIPHLSQKSELRDRNLRHAERPHWAEGGNV